MFILKNYFIASLILFSGMFSVSCKPDDPGELPPPPSVNANITSWLTRADQSAKLLKQTDALTFTQDSSLPTLSMDPETSYQEMDGFGFSLTGGSAKHIFDMSEEKRQKLLLELFDTTDYHIGISYLRVSIGASDLDESVFSYNDLPLGETDTDLSEFSIEKDRAYLIPVLKEILEIAPDIKILGSPWSAPLWMKSNQESIGGSLKDEYMDVYADYFVKYIEAYQLEGITIDAITPQNEPLHDGNNPSMYMIPEQQAEFIKNHLGPAFVENGISTKIIIYDHNADRIDYPISILNDPAAKQYIDGSAFHLYGGSIDDLSQVKDAHPDKNLYFTEQWIGAPGNFQEDLLWHTKNLVIGATKNWCKTVLEWNLAANSDLKPHTPGGCTACLGALTIDGDHVTRNPAYYIIGQASKFIRPGAKRIHSNNVNGLHNVAFKNTDGSLVLLVLNESAAEVRFNIAWNDKSYTTTLSANSVSTYIF